MTPRQRVVAHTARFAPKLLPLILRAGIALLDSGGDRAFMKALYASAPVDFTVASHPEVFAILREGYRFTVAQGHRAFEIDAHQVVQDWTQLAESSHQKVLLLHGGRDPVVGMQTVHDFAARLSSPAFPWCSAKVAPWFSQHFSLPLTSQHHWSAGCWRGDMPSLQTRRQALDRPCPTPSTNPTQASGRSSTSRRGSGYQGGEPLKKLLLGIGAAILVAIVAPIVFNLMFAGGEDYNTDFPPPSAGATAGQLFPETVAGSPRRIERISVGNNSVGYIARYGARTSITIVHSTDQAVIDAQAAQVVERTKMFDSRSSGKFNGVWAIKAYGQPGRIYAWQKQDWFYSVEAATDPMFLEMVDKFPLIAVHR